MEKELTDEELKKYPLISLPLRKVKYEEAMERVKKAYEDGKSVDKAIEEIMQGVITRIITKEDIIDYYNNRDREEQIKETKEKSNEISSTEETNKENEVTSEESKPKQEIVEETKVKLGEDTLSEKENSFFDFTNSSIEGVVLRINWKYDTNSSVSDIQKLFKKLNIRGNNSTYCTKGKYGKIFYNFRAIDVLYNYIDNKIEKYKRRVIIFSLYLQNIEIVRKFKVESFIVEAILNNKKLVREVLADKIAELNEEIDNKNATFERVNEKLIEKLKIEYATNNSLRNIIKNLSFLERLEYLFTKKMKKIDEVEISPELEEINKGFGKHLFLI